MAAQRLGSILTNVTGTSKQLLRVNEAETGFEFVSPASLPAYTITNDTTDRAIDANNVNLDELADVVSTLIKDMANIYSGAGGISAFTWSTSEQVWPFEKDELGRTLYCKQLDTGALPDNGAVFTNHNISSFDHSRVFKVYGKATYSGASMSIIPNLYTFYSIRTTQIVIVTNANVSQYTTTTHMIYAK